MPTRPSISIVFNCLIAVLGAALCPKAAFAADNPSPTTSPAPRGVIYLKKGIVAPAPGGGHPLLTRELFRQALLISARDELGLQTRDESLREWPDGASPPPEK